MNILETQDRRDAATVKMSFYWMLLAGVIMVFASIGPSVLSSEWVSSIDFHSCIEITGSFIGLLACGRYGSLGRAPC